MLSIPNLTIIFLFIYMIVQIKSIKTVYEEKMKKIIITLQKWKHSLQRKNLRKKE